MPLNDAIITMLVAALTHAEHAQAQATLTIVRAAQARYQVAHTAAERTALLRALCDAEAILVCLAAAGRQAAQQVAPLHQIRG